MLRRQWTNPLHTSQLSVFRYIDSDFSVTLTPGTPSIYFFRGNSLFDPDSTGVGVQPYGYDQLMGPGQLFYFYNVFASKIRVHFHAETAVKHLRVAVFPMRTAAPAYDDPSDISTVPKVKQVAYDSEDGSQGTSLVDYCSTKALHPETNQKDQYFVAVYNSNPSYTWFWNVYFYLPGSEDQTVVNFDVAIKYYARVTRYGTTNES